MFRRGYTNTVVRPNQQLPPGGGLWKQVPLHFRCVAATFRCYFHRLKILNQSTESTKGLSEVKVFAGPLQVSASASLWSVTETRTVRMVWMNEAVSQTAASNPVTWINPPQTLTWWEKGEQQ